MIEIDMRLLIKKINMRKNYTEQSVYTILQHIISNNTKLSSKIAYIIRVYIY